MMESKRAANSKAVQMVLRPALRESKCISQLLAV